LCICIMEIPWDGMGWDCEAGRCSMYLITSPELNLVCGFFREESVSTLFLDSFLRLSS